MSRADTASNPRARTIARRGCLGSCGPVSHRRLRRGAGAGCATSSPTPSEAAAAVRGPLPRKAAPQGPVVAAGDRRRRRPSRAARRRRRRLVLGPLGRADGDRARVPAGRLVAEDDADDADRAGVVLHPPRGLSARAGALPPGAGGVRHRRGAQRLPAGQHRHVRDAADVRGDHARRQLRRGGGRDAGAEDLLHARGRVRLRLPVRDRAGHLRAPVRAAARPPAR